MKRLFCYVFFSILLTLFVDCSTSSKVARIGTDIDKSYIPLEIYSFSYNAMESFGAKVQEVMIIDNASKSYDWYLSAWSPLIGDYTEANHAYGRFEERGDSLYWKPLYVYSGELIIPADSIPLINKFTYGDFGIRVKDKLHLQFDDGSGVKRTMRKR